MIQHKFYTLAYDRFSRKMSYDLSILYVNINLLFNSTFIDCIQEPSNNRIFNDLSWLYEEGNGFGDKLIKINKMITILWIKVIELELSENTLCFR